MHVGKDLVSLISKKNTQLDSLSSQIAIAKKSGKFYRQTSRKQTSLLTNLHRLAKQLERLKWQFTVATFGGAIAAIANPQDAVAQSMPGPFVQQKRATNPLRHPVRKTEQTPTAVDLDNDGDYDIVVGEQYGYIRIYLNEGSSTSPAFSEYLALDDSQIPLNLGAGGAPAFADLNNDGNLDLIYGTHGGSPDRVLFFAGNGGIPGDQSNPLLFTQQTGPWDPVAKTGNPFEGVTPEIDTFYYTPTFVNFDGDGDMDLLLGHNYEYQPGLPPNIDYYENDGQSNFSQGTFTTNPPINVSNYNRATPQLADIDQDGNLDFVVGSYQGTVRFFKGDGVNNNEQTGVWDPVLKTGNPFNGISFNRDTAPSFVDLDNDGDLDMVLGGVNSYKYTNDTELAYYQNEGSAVFVKQSGLKSPFGGVDVGYEAAPFFVDLDGDGDLDVVSGRDDSSYDLSVYINNNGNFTEDPLHPIAQLGISTDNIKPVFVDIDNDNDQDFFVALDNEVIFYRNNSGSFDIETSPIDVSGLISGTEYSLAFADVDGDDDWDALLGNDGFGVNPSLVQYMENQGTVAVPNFVVAASPPPFDTEGFVHTPNVFSADIDHDGDLDILVAESVYDGSLLDYITTFRFFENNGDQTFSEISSPISTSKKIANHSYISMADIDGDGDLDVFIGVGDDLYSSESGTIVFLENQNPAPLTTVNSNTVVYNFGSGPMVVDASITIADSDNDLITRAVIVIQGYDIGDILSFTPQGNVTGSFDTVTGTLTLSGLAPISTYQTILRSVTYDFTGAQPTSSGRKGSPAGRTVVVNKSLELTVFDSDFTNPSIQTIAVALTVQNIVPTIASAATPKIFTGPPIIVDGTLVVSDNDDADLMAATVQISPSSFVVNQDELLFTNQNGITGFYNTSTGVLTLTGLASVANYQTALRSVQYQNTSSTPTSTARVIEIFVDDGESPSNIISNTVAINQPPAITSSTLNTVINNSITIDLTTIINDPDGNLDPLSFKVIPNVSPTPTRVGSATISSSILTIDYFGTNFAGTDFVTIEACDLSGLCATAEITVQVAGEIIVRNGLSPNGDGLNDFFKLENINSIEPQNTVTIFNRWGDKVFEVKDYLNTDPTRRFNGKSDGGKDLPSGVYFYKVEFVSGADELTGYLTLKR